MTKRDKIKRLFSLVLQYYYLYRDASITRETYYNAQEIEWERELSIRNRHIPAMAMSKESFNASMTTTGLFSLVEFILSGNPPIFTLLIASMAYGLYVKNNIDQHNIDLEHLDRLKRQDAENIRQLKKIVQEIRQLSKELDYDVKLYTGWVPTEEELYHLQRYYQAELDRLCPNPSKILKH